LDCDRFRENPKKSRLDADDRQGGGDDKRVLRERNVTDLHIRENKGAVRNAVGIRYGVFPGNMKLSFQAARSIG